MPYTPCGSITGPNTTATPRAACADQYSTCCCMTVRSSAVMSRWNVGLGLLDLMKKNINTRPLRSRCSAAVRRYQAAAKPAPHELDDRRVAVLAVHEGRRDRHAANGIAEPEADAA